MKTQWTSLDQFTLLSDQTKRRINSLIGMKLTPQTIALFAQEYEDYDFAVRLQIAELISFLINKELTDYVNEINKEDSKNDALIQFKKKEYEQRAENIKKLQDVLVNNRSVTTANEKFENDKKSKETKKLKKDERKTTLPTPKIDESKRPQLVEVDSKKSKSEKVQKVVKEKVVKTKVEKPKKEKPLKEVKTKVEKPKVEKVEKPKINADLLVKQQKEAIEKRIQKEKEDYEKQQLEKEKLWRELYGKSRKETHDARNGSNSNGNKKSDSKDEQNKIPLMKDQKVTAYRLYGYTYSIDEIIDPKNKVYLFWVNYKHRYFVGNLFNHLENIKPSLQKKLWKKRNKWVRKFHLEERANKTKAEKIIKAEQQSQQEVQKTTDVETAKQKTADQSSNVSE